MIDQHYTPEWLADYLVANLPHDLQGVVVDPSSGSGALLAALERAGHSGAQPIAIDCDVTVTRALRRQRPSWIVSTANSVDLRSFGATRAWRELKRRGVAAVLLNPPFSYRGGPSSYVEFGSFAGRLSPAVEFVAMALSHLRPRISLLAILPNGAINGQKSAPFWSAVRQNHTVEVLRELPRSTFPGVSARCSVIRISPIGRQTPAMSCTKSSVAPHSIRRGERCSCVEVIRGRVPRHHVHPSSESVAPYVHTTHLIGNTLSTTVDAAPWHLGTDGPSVVLPRVGRPRGKIATVGAERLVLSDCLFALRSSERNLESLAGSLAADVDSLDKAFMGTGAPYITVEKLVGFLKERGWTPYVSNAASGSFRCRCSVEGVALGDLPDAWDYGPTKAPGFVFDVTNCARVSRLPAEPAVEHLTVTGELNGGRDVDSLNGEGYAFRPNTSDAA